MKQELTTQDYVYHLWKRRLVLLAFPALVVILVYLGMRYLHGETFETRAMVMVRMQPRISMVESEELGIQPPAFQSLFTSDETIAYIRNQYNDMYERDIFPPEATHKEMKAPLEKLRSRFDVTSGTTVDTTISTKFSPVLEFSYKGTTRDQALVVMELWTNYCIREYGNLLNDEAEALMVSNDIRTHELQTKLQDYLQKNEELIEKKKIVDTRMRSIFRQLTAVPVSDPANYVTNEVLPFNMDTGPFQTTVEMPESMPELGPGLWEQMNALSLEINSAGTDEATDQKVAKIYVLNNQIQELETQLFELATESSTLGGQIAGNEVQLNALQYSIRLNSSLYAQAQALRRPMDKQPDSEVSVNNNQEAYGTLRLMTRPVLPNKRISPARTLVAIIAGFATGVFLLLLFCGERFMRHVVDQENAA